MFRRFAAALALAACATTALPAQQPPAEPKISFSGYVQPQYQVELAGGDRSDRALLRRAVVTFDVEMSGNWRGELQADLGPVTSGGDRVIVKNAFLQFTGWKDQGVLVTAGNQKLPFSRALLASSSRRGLVERPFTGDRGLGSPGRALSLKVDGWHRARTLYWSAAVAESRQSGERDEIRIDGPAEAGDDGYEGNVLAGRLEWHPLGEVSRDHGDFARGPVRLTAGVAAYGWWNDGDVRAGEGGGAEAARASGLELSGALRGQGLSVDAEFERITAAARPGSTDGGIYAGGEAAIRKASIEAGYMVLRERLEALAAIDEADTRTFDRPWRRAAAGVNWYVRRHALKFSLMHREGFNHLGVRGRRSRATYLQSQLAF